MDLQEEIIYQGPVRAGGKDAHFLYLFTRHAGGEFEARKISRCSSFVLEYEGQREGMDIAFVSHSGGCPWARLKPDRITELDKGVFRGEITYDALKNAFGEEFSYLDEFRGIVDTNEEMTLRRFYYLPGTGEPVDDHEAKWRRAEGRIAFIGDSIVENVRFHCGDFNTLLGRGDCVNYGIGAQTSKHCLNRMEELTQRSFRQMVVWCGINDIGMGDEPKEIADRIGAMCEKMRVRNADVRFAVISVLPTTATFFSESQNQIVELNRCLKALVAAHEDMAFVDCYPMFLGGNGYCREELVLDGLHPNGEGYRIVAQTLKPYLLKEEK